MSESAAARWSATAAASLDLRSARAAALFMACDRSRAARTARPVGRCFTRTAVSTLLTFWPPAPPARIVVISRSAGSSSATSGGSAGWSSGSSGTGSTLAKDVWRLAAELKGDWRTSRCAPRSARSSPKALGPRSSSDAALRPPGCSPSARSSSSTAKSRRSPKRWYMRSSMAVQSWASRPPAPAVSSRRQSHASYGPSSARAASYASAPARKSASASAAASA
mmetsp:Transcript_23971/g.71898  ORF Transcript_23971/g.71898 Transcript_23971/m.71898 type:complete len:223 (-) Transcript_23971:140-808(-)